MTKIQINISDCTSCPFHKTTRQYTADSWERADDWWCTQTGKDIKVASYVEWTNDVEIPDWCPIMVKELSVFYESGDGEDDITG
jgi:hypothetical protein